MYEIITQELTNWSESYTGPKYHAVLSDPPYDLAFMNKSWDRNADFKSWGEALLPHLFPGAICLLFGGTRTWHRLATGMEDAGFVMFDTLMWLYGSGFPKAQDISKLIDDKLGNEREVIGHQTKARTSGTNDVAMPSIGGQTEYKTWNITASTHELSSPWAGHKTPALKPAWEPILAFRKPSKHTYAELALDHGSGAIDIDACRIGTDVVGWGGSPSNGYSGSLDNAEEARPVAGRFPTNLILDEETSASLGDRSRFFYCAKASKSERDAGLDAFEPKARPTMGSGIGGQPDQEKANNKNIHPCVKPLKLSEYLAKLLLPPSTVSDRRLLVPFAGSGSEMIGALRAGWDSVTGIEMNSEYAAIATARLKHWTTG